MFITTEVVTSQVHSKVYTGSMIVVDWIIGV